VLEATARLRAGMDLADPLRACTLEAQGLR